MFVDDERSGGLVREQETLVRGPLMVADPDMRCWRCVHVPVPVRFPAGARAHEVFAGSSIVDDNFDWCPMSGPGVAAHVGDQQDAFAEEESESGPKQPHRNVQQSLEQPARTSTEAE